MQNCFAIRVLRFTKLIQHCGAKKLGESQDISNILMNRHVYLWKYSDHNYFTAIFKKGSGIMKKVLPLLPVLCMLLCGCSTLYAERKLAEGYENSEYETVNTSKINSTYSLSPTMRKLRNAVMEGLGENYWPNALYTSEELMERTGISEEMYDSFLAEYEHTEAGTDMMILIEAKEDDLATVEQLLDNYRELLLELYKSQPLNRAKVEASRIEVIDHFVCFVQLGADTTPYKNSSEKERIAYCQDQNEQALDILEKRIYAKEGF